MMNLCLVRRMCEMVGLSGTSDYLDTRPAAAPAETTCSFVP